MNKALYFLLGTVVGAAGTYLFLKDRYERYAQEFYDHKYEERENNKKEPDEVKKETSNDQVITDKPDLMEYAKKLAEQRYGNKEEPVEDGPYVISPDEAGDEDYDEEALILYSDGVLAYENNDEIVDNADELVGTEFYDHFGTYDENTVFVRNDAEHIEFEIFKDVRTYEEVSGNKPHGTEEE